MQPIRVSRSIGFDWPLAPDAEAVLKGIETEMIWRGNRTVRLTPGEYVFRGPGVARALLPDGGPTTWLVRSGRISFAVPQWSLRVELDLDPVSLFLVPLGVATVLALLPLDPQWRAGLMGAGAFVWAAAYVHAWTCYRAWISRGARQPWQQVTPRQASP